MDTLKKETQMKEFLEWAGLEEIFAKWEANENLPDEDKNHELDFEREMGIPRNAPEMYEYCKAYLEGEAE